jgi:MBG domain (YGX type)
VTGAGTIVVVANQAGNTNCTAAAQVTADIAVNQAALTVAANNATKVYGTANPAFTGSVTGAVNGNTFTESFATAATTITCVGA